MLLVGKFNVWVFSLLPSLPPPPGREQRKKKADAECRIVHRDGGEGGGGEKGGSLKANKLSIERRKEGRF